MRLTRPMRRQMPETIVALIDVVFFLLVFFMLVGRMDATSPFEVTPAVAVTGSDMPAGGATVSLGQDGAIALDAFAVDKADLLARLEARLVAEPDLLVRINAHKDTELRHLLPLVADIEAIGARDVILVVTPTSGEG